MSAIRQLATLTDFLSEEELKFLPGGIFGRFEAGTFIILKQLKVTQDEKGVTHFGYPIQVFTKKGIWIGEITEPDYIPKKDQI